MTNTRPHCWKQFILHNTLEVKGTRQSGQWYLRDGHQYQPSQTVLGVVRDEKMGPDRESGYGCEPPSLRLQPLDKCHGNHPGGHTLPSRCPPDRHPLLLYEKKVQTLHRWFRENAARSTNLWWCDQERKRWTRKLAELSGRTENRRWNEM